MENENKLTVRFELEDGFGNKHSATSTEEIFYTLGDRDALFIGRQLSAFLKQCGYNYKNGYIFMEDITEDEYDELADYLEEYRENKKSEQRP